VARVDDDDRPLRSRNPQAPAHIGRRRDAAVRCRAAAEAQEVVGTVVWEWNRDRRAVQLVGSDDARLASSEPELKRLRVPIALVNELSINSAPWLLPVGLPQ
jgi:hypothetical protein